MNKQVVIGILDGQRRTTWVRPGDRAPLVQKKGIKVISNIQGARWWSDLAPSLRHREAGSVLSDGKQPWVPPVLVWRWHTSGRFTRVRWVRASGAGWEVKVQTGVRRTSLWA